MENVTEDFSRSLFVCLDGRVDMNRERSKLQARVAVCFCFPSQSSLRLALQHLTQMPGPRCRLCPMAKFSCRILNSRPAIATPALILLISIHPHALHIKATTRIAQIPKFRSNPQHLHHDVIKPVVNMTAYSPTRVSHIA